MSNHRWIPNDTPCLPNEDADAGYEVEVVDAKAYDDLQRELADVIAHRDSETRWAAQYKRERDRARDALKDHHAELLNARALLAVLQLFMDCSNPQYKDINSFLSSTCLHNFRAAVEAEGER